MDRDGRQAQIYAWAKQEFTAEQATSLPQRGLRLLEEAIEAFQAVGGDQQQAHRLIEYVFSRPAGVLHQELGGVGVTLLALAAAADLSADEEEAREVARVLSKPVEEFTRRNVAKNEAGFLALSIPHLGALATPVRHGWRECVTFPVELEESEALLLDVTIREKFFGSVDQRQCVPPPEADRLLEKVRRVQNKFLDKRRADEEFAVSLTDEEREIIRSRRANTGRKDK